MEQEKDLASLFPCVASQLRNALGTLHLAAARLAPTAAREQDPELDKKAALLDQSYYQMLRMISSLSSAAHLTDDSPLPLQNRDLVALVGNLCDEAGDSASLLGLDLQFLCAAEHHICAVAPDAVEQILYHLLSNAFKFTPSGGRITVELRFTANRVLLSVTDTGCGISEEHLPALFDRYLHKDQLVPYPHGLGLGLPVCRALAQRQGGVLMAESQVGKGSRFTISLPDRQVENGVSDVPFDYTGGFNRTLLALADVLPTSAFLTRNQK